jgi:signal transduction histidine kinase
MDPKDIAALINLLGFITGAALYAMLLAMVLRTGGRGYDRLAVSPTEHLLLATAVLGLLWNLGALVIYGLRDWNIGQPSPWMVAASFTALGFLPAVLVHAALRTGEALARRRGALLLTGAAYGLSASAASMNFYAAAVANAAPSPVALRMLTFGFSGLIIALAIYTRRQAGWQRALWAVALAVFAVSALHLSHHRTNDDSWLMELAGHHASLPLALAILYQDYRFALADIFLKRALALIALMAVAFGMYVVVVARLLGWRDAHHDLDPRAIGALLGLWIATALLYPTLRRAIVWFVDEVILRRADYQALCAEIANLVVAHEAPEAILEQVGARLAPALTAGEVRWVRADRVTTDAADLSEHWHSLIGGADVVRPLPVPGELVRVTANETATGAHSAPWRAPRPTAIVLVPTTDPPQYLLVIGELAGGRKLLSDDIAMLESVALLVARRIDAVRVMHERCARTLHEQEISKLATEAELRALRAQLNPHFLFNALTTISYLIQTAPERALDTLMRLTGLLRAVLRRSDGESATLGEELDLVESYLAIERARFEERLRVQIEVPPALRAIRLPPLVLQPLVENAVKHGIAPCKTGGELVIAARLETAERERLCLTVLDTGAGASENELSHGRRLGVGLANVERRLECYYGETASLKVHSTPGVGTVVEVRLPSNVPSEMVAELEAQS